MCYYYNNERSLTWIKRTNKQEVTLFHHHGKKARPTLSRPLQDLTPVAIPKALLAESKRLKLLQNITESCALDSPRFDSLCMKLLHNFTNQCQSLPETANSYYALPGGLLDHALNRTEAALHLLCQQMVPGHDAELSEEQKLWLYALFSAAILQGIGKLQLDYRIELFDVNGLFSRLWNPLLEGLASNARYYHYEFTQGSEDDLRCRLNLLLAYQLMPESGFSWIAGNPQVLAVWLALLNEDPNAAGMLGLILERADAIAIQRDLNAFLIRHTASGGGRANRISTFIDAPESSIGKEHVLGAEFIKWLTQQLEKGRFSINKLPIMMLPAGLHMTIETYKFFMREHPDTRLKTWQAVHNGLISLGLHHREANNHTANPNDKTSQNGIILNKFAVVLPDKMQLHDPATGKETTVTAIEMMRIQKSLNNREPLHHLTQSGEWQAVEANTPELQSGYSRRE